MLPHSRSAGMHGRPKMTMAAACAMAPAEIMADCCCCKRCGIAGCDVKVLDCGCCFHTRCLPHVSGGSLITCSICHHPARVLMLIPMKFDELDKAQAEAAQTKLSDKRGKKRQNATISRLDPERTSEDPTISGELRTGRWTAEETEYCDRLIELFETGSLPIPDSIKLNDFLSSMLKSKQSRLTKKMKNARLSARQYQHKQGFIESIEEAIAFSQLESQFFRSIKCNMERSEIRFHMQKVWRELFSAYASSIGHKLEAGEWLASVEEIDRRVSRQKDAARTARRKIMMGYALSHDATHQPSGVFIEPVPTSLQQSEAQSICLSRNSSSDTLNRTSKRQLMHTLGAEMPPLRPLSYYSSPFVGKIVHYIRKNNIPFEYVDAWVPSQVQLPSESVGMPTEYSSHGNEKSRLCFGGWGMTEIQIPPDDPASVGLSEGELFDLTSFGMYSQRFSFDVGCGLPGRVYQTGVASWERGVQKAPTDLFERCGGAKQWGIQTVLGIPVASPSVGRIVVLFYSRFDRPNDPDLVTSLMEKLTKMMPSPKWKLIVDIGVSTHDEEDVASQDTHFTTELLNKLTKYMPQDQRSPLAEFLPGFSSIRLLLTTNNQTYRERALLDSVIACYKTYEAAGKSEKESTWMTARDLMTLTDRNQIAEAQAPQEVNYDDLGVMNTVGPININVHGTNQPTAHGAMYGNSVLQPTSSHHVYHDPGQVLDNHNQPGAGMTDQLLNQFVHKDSIYNHSSTVQSVPHANNQVDPFVNLAPFGFSAAQLSSLFHGQPGTHTHFSGM